MKKIRKRLIISSYDDITNPYYAGGGAVVTHKLAQQLKKRYQVTVITSRHKISQKSGTMDGVYYQRVGLTPNWFPQLGQLIFLMILPFYARKNNFDAWLESFTPPFSSAFLPSFTSKPIIGIVHYLAGKKMSQQYKLPFHLIEAEALKKYRNFIVPSESVKNELSAATKNSNIAVIHNGIDLPRLKKKLGKEKKIVYIGRISVEQKGLDLLLTAFAKLSNSSDWKLVICGNGVPSEEKKLNKLIHQMKLENKVSLLGKVNGDQKDKILQSSSIFVVSSREETFSLSALEAMAYGIPIVSFDIPGLSWIPSQSGKKAKSFSVASFTNALKNVINDESLRNNIFSFNRMLSKKFTWVNMANRYQKVIESVI